MKPWKIGTCIFVLAVALITVALVFIYIRKPFPGNFCISNRQCGLSPAEVKIMLKEACKDAPPSTRCIPAYQSGTCQSGKCNTVMSL